MVNTPNELIYELLRHVENKEDRLIVDDACTYLGHPEDPDDIPFQRCFCRQRCYSKKIPVRRDFKESPKNSFLVIPIDDNGNKDEEAAYYILK